MFFYIIFSAMFAASCGAAVNISSIVDVESENANTTVLELTMPIEPDNTTDLEPVDTNNDTLEVTTMIMSTESDNEIDFEPEHVNNTIPDPIVLDTHDQFGNETGTMPDFQNSTFLEPVILTATSGPAAPANAIESADDIAGCPSTVVIQKEVQGKWFFHCVGSLVATNKVVSSASCAQTKASSFRVLLGTNTFKLVPGTQVIYVVAVYVHPNFKAPTTSGKELLSNDLAVLKLANHAVLSNRVQTIELSDSDKHLAGQNCIVAGFRFRGSKPGYNQLHVPVIDQRTCQAALEHKYKPNRIFIRPVHLCTLDPVENPCIGDAGSPLVCGGRLFGVLSTYDLDCLVAPETTAPATFMSVACYRHFLDHFIGL